LCPRGDFPGEGEVLEVAVLGDVEEEDCLEKKDDRWLEPEVLDPTTWNVREDLFVAVVTFGEVDLAVLLVLPWNSSSDDSSAFIFSSAFLSDICV